MKPGTDRGFFVERAVFFFMTSQLKGRAEIKPHFSKAAAALLCAYNEAWYGSRLFCSKSGFVFCDLSVFLR
jgi:hypothetical protein